MLVAVQQGEVQGLTLIGLFVAGAIGIPISVAIVNGRRAKEAAKYRRLEGWVPGTLLEEDPDAFAGPPPPSTTPGPRIVAHGALRVGRWVRVAYGTPAPRPEPWASAEPSHRATLAPASVTEGSATGQDAHLRARHAGNGSVTAEPLEDAEPGSPGEGGRDSGESGEARSGDAPVRERADQDIEVRVTPESARGESLEVRVLGPVEILGWREAPTRRVVAELACYLALHGDRRVTSEELRAALWPGDIESTQASAKSLRNAVSMLRKSLGPEVVPEASKGRGYRLAGDVRSDWARFSLLVKSARPGDEEEADLLDEALRLVRGAPFEGVASGSYSWAWGELFVSRMEVAVADAARRLAVLGLASGDVGKARAAATKGLACAPYDRRLWELMLESASALGRGELDRTWKHAVAVLGDDVADLRECFDRLHAKPPAGGSSNPAPDFATSEPPTRARP